MQIIALMNIICLSSDTGNPESQSGDSIRIQKVLKEIVSKDENDPDLNFYFTYSTSPYSFLYEDDKVDVSEYIKRMKAKDLHAESKLRLIENTADIVFKSTQSIECRKGEINQLLENFLKGEWGNYKNEFNASMDFLSSGLRGIAITINKAKQPKYIFVFTSTVVQELIGNTGKVCIIEIHYDGKNRINDVNYCFIAKNDAIIKAIDSLWEKLDIGVWSDKPDDWTAGFFFMPKKGIKEKVYSIDEFRILHLQAEIDYVKKSWAKERETLENLEKTYAFSGKKDEDLKKRIDKLKDLIENHRDPKYIKDLEDKLNSLKNK